MDSMFRCPICNEIAFSICKCFRHDSECKNGHTWHTCTIHNIIVLGKSDHSIPTMTCTCKKVNIQFVVPIGGSNEKDTKST